jgi:hypothetical protein
MKGGTRVAAVLILAAVATGAGAVSASIETNATAARVKVKLVEFKVIPSVKRAAAGKVTFVVRNAGQIPRRGSPTRATR